MISSSEKKTARKQKVKDFIEIFVTAVLMGSGFLVGLFIVSKIIELF